MRTMSSMNFAIGDIILVPIPFTDLTSRKVRPAVVIGLSTQMKDLFVIPISSQLQNAAVAFRDWRAAGLNVPCGIKPQIATLEERLILKRIGRLSANDQGAVTSTLRSWLNL